jgi:hypothetical protein
MFLRDVHRVGKGGTIRTAMHMQTKQKPVAGLARLHGVSEREMTSLAKFSSKAEAFVGFNRYVAAAIIVTRSEEEQEQLLDSIQASNQRRSVAASLAAIRLSLGLPADHALEISSGRYE